ncbi:phosphoribosylaminoimidazolesuccinocarboxamide synthase [Geoglobus acetivorans]|uniref:Phosphoribosylaminoimidazole-succinocarboxamide synthase n=1 Tax=Geoglobus acetivorans TaxID=565033 RepID=A0A0A7GF74_GEOAI|nr:Phosphoribosylaminoimidazole-succinocarboxamide synthase [Geoglobus acetivorans]
MGSVKDLTVIKKPEENRTGIGRFLFSDRYSVFDYGEMSDHIENKGKALCLISAYFFEILENDGISTHYIGLVEGGKVKRLNELDDAVNEMEVRLVRVVEPEKTGSGYDYSIFKNLNGNYLIPLEVIYRNSLPEGSSVFRRLEKGEISPEDLGLTEIPGPGSRLEKPVIDFSTKLEDTDRYLRRKEALKISGLSEEEFEELVELAEKIDRIITEEVGKAGIENLDGKVEFALDENRKIMLVDAVGTPDECRFSFDGIEMSKEILRKYYRKTEWYRLVEKFKGEENWRVLAGRPPKLPEDLKNAVSEMYMSACNEITGMRFFDSPSLKDVMKRISEFMEVYDG